MNKENMSVEDRLDHIFALNDAMYGKLHSKREKNRDLKHRINLLIQSQRQAAVEELMPVVRAALNWKDPVDEKHDRQNVLFLVQALEALPPAIINKAKGE